MIVVKIELWPFGEEEKKEIIGEMHIINNLTGDRDFGNYDVRAHKAFSFDTGKLYWKHGSVKNHMRSLSVYHLLYKSLQSILKGKRS